MKKQFFAIQTDDQAFLSRMAINETPEGPELDVDFNQDVTECLTVKKAKYAQDFLRLLKATFKDRTFKIVSITKSGGKLTITPAAAASSA